MRRRSFYFGDGLILAIQLLTTIPFFKKQVEWEPKRAKSAVMMFPVVGLIIGGLLGLQYVVLTQWTTDSSLVLAFSLIFMAIIYSGGLHLDGWMDVCDAIFSRRDRERKLEIMKDSHVGAFAIIGILFLLGWKFIFMYELLSSSDDLLAFVLLIPFFSRLLMGLVLYFGKLARETGMAATFKPHLDKSILVGYGLMFLIVAVVASLLSLKLLYFIFALFIVVMAFLLFVLKLSKRHFGGITGDVLGASAEGGELVLWFGVWLLHFFVTG